MRTRPDASDCSPVDTAAPARAAPKNGRSPVSTSRAPEPLEEHPPLSPPRRQLRVEPGSDRLPERLGAGDARTATARRSVGRDHRPAGRAWRTPRAGARPAPPDAAVRSGRSRRRRPPRLGRARPRAAEAIASATARSAPGSSIRTPPATLTKTSAAPRATPACRESTATIIASRFGSTPVATLPRHREVGTRDERLDLEQDRPRALERAGNRGPDLTSVRATEELGWIRDADEPDARHLEDAELVRRSEPVLHGPQDTMCVVAVALELKDAVDEVLEHPRPRDRPVLRHVTHEDRRDSLLLGDAKQSAGRLPHLPDRAGSGAELGRVQRLHRVDHAHVRPLALERRADRLELGLGQDLDVLGAPEALGAKLDLRHRLLAGDEQRPAPGPCHVPERREQQASTSRRRARLRRARARPARGRHRAHGRAPARRSRCGRPPRHARLRASRGCEPRRTPAALWRRSRSRGS